MKESNFLLFIYGLSLGIALCMVCTILKNNSSEDRTVVCSDYVQEAINEGIDPIFLEVDSIDKQHIYINLKQEYNEYR